ncbi:MAG: hypothetical protein EXR27_13930 [Betaproteobacteria bacterium]|nr:hypothetical protein [Betaproteobacteria bacterium]
MLGLQLRDEFRGAKLQGTTIDFSDDSKTGALDQSAKKFLRITYPFVDVIKTLQAIAPGANRAVVLVGDRGQGKSHLMAAASPVSLFSRAYRPQRAITRICRASL